MRILIAGGGTGGHLYPGIALAREFQRLAPESRVLFAGTEKGLEARIIPKEGYELRLIHAGGLIGKGVAKRLLVLLGLPYGLYQSFRLLREIRPALVVGTGGYASGPILLMSWFLRMPRVLVEPNSYPGWTNRILAPLADRIFVAFKETREVLGASEKVRISGNPVRREIGNLPMRPEPRPLKWTLLVMGGSQGAHAINMAMAAALESLSPMKGEVRIIHQTGEQDQDGVREAYRQHGFEAKVTPYLENIAEAYAESDLVVSRSGATTVAELLACGRPSILIPYPYSAHGHQEANARSLQDGGAAMMIREADLTGPGLAGRIRAALSDPDRLHAMARQARALGRPGAATEIVKACLELVNSSRFTVRS
jgi:UDP-N-acetylglucosamine--N-acetylmuramyl-(pentapeptide) pyrophosphoryl-undecaprenol N-acetylglucosamine transferase